MKELSIEEKAKRYDEALKVLHKYDGANIMFSQSLKEEMFPELKESKNWIPKEIIKYLKGKGDFRSCWIAWLEKQGEHADFRNKIQVGDKVTRNEDGVLVNLSQLKRVAKKDEKQGEQKPAELGENRSKELSLSLQIQAYLNTASDELYAKGKPLYSEKRMEDIHKCMLMWQKLHNAYFYQKPTEWSEEDKKMSRFIGNAITADDASEYLKSKGIQVIDAHLWLEELKDRVQPKQEWSEEDESLRLRTIGALETCKIGSPTKCVDEQINWLKSLKDRVQPQSKKEWSEEDKAILEKCIGAVKVSCYSYSFKSKAENWLKSLKDRVLTQPKQEWSEEDVNFIEATIGLLNLVTPIDAASWGKSRLDCVDWLKSLRHRNTWKPSDEQMQVLSDAGNYNSYL